MTRKRKLGCTTIRDLPVDLLQRICILAPGNDAISLALTTKATSGAWKRLLSAIQSKQSAEDQDALVSWVKGFKESTAPCALLHLGMPPSTFRRLASMASNDEELSK